MLNVNLLPVEQIERVFKEYDERYYKEVNTEAEEEATRKICDNLNSIMKQK